MDYVITIGKNYIGCDSGGKYTEVSSINQATRGPMHKMQNFVNNCVGPSLRSKCKVVELAKAVSVATKPVVSNVATVAPVQSVADSIVAELKKIDVSAFEKEGGYLNEKLSQIDKEISDIMHYIEFTKLNAAEGYNAYRLLREKRIERRAIKDDFEKFQVVSNAKISDIFNGALEKKLNDAMNRTYTPRVLTELFEEE